jgi:hypothetical protein
MSPRMIRVFVNATGVEVPAGATALDAVRAWNAAVAGEVSSGVRLITDSRGLPIGETAPMSAGSILRLVPNRGGASADAEQ